MFKIIPVACRKSAKKREHLPKKISNGNSTQSNENLKPLKGPSAGEIFETYFSTNAEFST